MIFNRISKKEFNELQDSIKIITKYTGLTLTNLLKDFEFSMKNAQKYKKYPENIEKFKKINNTNYSVSSFGRIFSHKNNKFLKPWITRNGYSMVHLCTNGKTTKFLVHRLVALHFRKNTFSDNFEVNHIDGNKRNNHVNNLEWRTTSDNLRHRYALKKGLL